MVISNDFLCFFEKYFWIWKKSMFKHSECNIYVHPLSNMFSFNVVFHCYIILDGEIYWGCLLKCMKNIVWRVRILIVNSVKNIISCGILWGCANRRGGNQTNGFGNFRNVAYVNFANTLTTVWAKGVCVHICPLI